MGRTIKRTQAVVAAIVHTGGMHILHNRGQEEEVDRRSVVVIVLEMKPLNLTMDPHPLVREQG